MKKERKYNRKSGITGVFKIKNNNANNHKNEQSSMQGIVKTYRYAVQDLYR